MKFYTQRDFELEPAGAGVVQQPPLLSEESLEADFFKGLVDVHFDIRIFVILKLKPAPIFMFAHRAHLSPLIPSCCFVIFQFSKGAGIKFVSATITVPFNPCQRLAINCLVMANFKDHVI